MCVSAQQPQLRNSELGGPHETPRPIAAVSRFSPEREAPGAARAGLLVQRVVMRTSWEDGDEVVAAFDDYRRVGLQSTHWNSDLRIEQPPHRRFSASDWVVGCRSQ